MALGQCRERIIRRHNTASLDYYAPMQSSSVLAGPSNTSTAPNKTNIANRFITLTRINQHFIQFLDRADMTNHCLVRHIKMELTDKFLQAREHSTSVWI